MNINLANFMKFNRENKIFTLFAIENISELLTSKVKRNFIKYLDRFFNTYLNINLILLCF